MPLSKETNDKQIKQLNDKIASLEAKNAKLEHDKRQLLSSANEIKYQTVFYNAPIGILHYDIHGTITDCNNLFVSVIGSSKEALIGLNMLNDLKDNNIIKAVKKSLTKGYAEYNDLYSSVTADKKTYVKVIFKGIKGIDGKIIEGLGIIEDISEQQEANLKLEQSEETYRNIFEQNAVGIAHVTPQIEFLHINKRFAEILGLSQKEALNTDFSKITHPEDISLDKRTILKALNNELDDFSIEKRYIHKKGHIVWVKLYAKVIRNTDGSVKYAIIAVNDISNQKKSEKALKKQKEKYYKLYSEYLEQNRELKKYIHQLEQANKDLKVAKNKAVESDTLKSAFLANLSHEIRTPMNGIIGFSSLLETAHDSRQQQLMYAKMIRESSQRMLNIITNIVNVSKLEAGIIDINETETNLNRLIDECEGELKSKISGKSIEIIVEKQLSNDDSNILIDTEKLRTILKNLLDNAAKYTSSGTIKLGYEVNKKIIEFYVSDTGPGIPADEKDSIFHYFNQGRLEGDNLNDGLGLGLSVVKGMIEQLGGNIYVSSDIDIGSTFLFSVPYNPSNKIKEQREEVGKTPLHEILIVEDNDPSFILVNEVFADSKYIIHHATDGEMAVGMAIEKDLDLVLMDIKLPGICGTETTKLIKQLKPDLPVVAITAYANRQKELKIDKAIFDAFFAKPVNVEILRQNAEELIKRSSGF